MSHEQIAAAEREAQDQKHADQHWEPLLRKWVSELSDRHRRAEAEANLAKVDDPRAVPSIARVLRGASRNGLLLAVRLLGQIDGPTSSRPLAALSVYNDDPDVRQAAALALKGREPRDFADRLVNLIHAPMTYQVQPVAGPGSRGALVIDSPRYRITRIYDAPGVFRGGNSTFRARGYVGYDGNGLPVVISGFMMDDVRHDFNHPDSKSLADAGRIIRNAEVRTAEMLAAANLKAAFARQRLAADVRELEEENAQAETLNQRAEEALRTALDSPADLREDDEDGWRTWYYDRIGYRYTPPPKIVAAVNAAPQVPAPAIVSCFAAGTPVRTLRGPRPIESLRTGDQVLSQDVSTGGLSFQPILAVHHNPPDATLSVATDNGDAVVASRFHRFWRVGRGWAMARDLKPGDVLRTIDGPTRIVSVEAAPVQPVFNLDVAESRTYFVGGSAMLVHDNTLPPTQPSTDPFDLASTSAPPRP
jgi:hypothetical protein